MTLQLRVAAAALACALTLTLASTHSGRAIAAEKNTSAELFAQAAELAITGNYSKAANLYRDALEQSPKNANERVIYANLLRDTGDVDAAIEALRAGLKADDSSADLHVRLGEMLEINGEEKAARLHYQRAVKLDPKSDAASDASANLKFLNDAGAEPAMKPEIKWSSDG